MFANTGQTLPWATQALIAISNFMRASIWVWIVGIVAGVIGARVALRNKEIRMRWHHMILRMPVVGRLARGVNAARFADTLGILTASGVPLLNALQSAVPVINNLPMRAAVDDAVRQVREGASLSRSLGKAKLFPPLVIHLIASGEASGRLDSMLQRRRRCAIARTRRLGENLTALLEPVLILTMGLVVLFIVVAILLPIFEMNQLIK